VKRAEVWWACDAPYGWAGRGRVREWKALVRGGVISEVGWLSLCGAPPRSFRVAPRSRVVWVEESGSGRLFPRGGNSLWLGCCCGARLRTYRSLTGLAFAIGNKGGAKIDYDLAREFSTDPH
jgi:hypothetical protein